MGREQFWTLGETEWPIEALRVVTPGRHHSVLLLWTEGFRELLKWYVNLEDPLARSPLGFDYLDWLLDIEIAPDLSTWKWKDTDELEDAVSNGLVSLEKADFIRAEGNHVLRDLGERAPPFDEQWNLWRPDTRWEIPCLPDGWDSLDDNPACGGDVSP